MDRRIKKYKTPGELAEELALKLKKEINNKSKIDEDFYLVLSGGSTPKNLFKILAEVPYKDDIKWESLQLFWGDERCLPPDDPESNYGETRKLLLDKIAIPKENVHRIIGEAKPEEETARYANEIQSIIPFEKSLPRFDCILLGVGEDGHTASLFPGKELYAVAQNICGVAEKSIPLRDGKNIQKRVSLTKDVICNSEQVFFLVTGEKKSKILSEIINEEPISRNYPAAGINNIYGFSEWRIDEDAASKL